MVEVDFVSQENAIDVHSLIKKWEVVEFPYGKALINIVAHLLIASSK